MNDNALEEVKPLERYKYNEIIDMKREVFDKSLAITEMNVGTLESLRKVLSVHYDNMKVQVDALSKLASKEETPEADKEKAVETIEQMYLIMFSMEYKATAIYDRVKKAQAQLS